MSDVQPRGASTRGRGGFRGGRGGYRGARGGKSHTSRDDAQHENVPLPLEDQGELGELKAKYVDKLPMMRMVCEGWSDEDLVFALQETNGDETAAIDRITSGTVSQWGEVKKKAPKAKDGPAGTDASTRGRSRGPGGLDSRGRGRGAERGARGAGRGARSASHANGTKPVDKAAKSTEDGLEEPAAATTNGDATTTADDWANEPGKDKLDSLATDKPKPAPAAAPGGKGGWAGLFAKPTPPPPPPKAEPAPVAAPAPAPATASAPAPAAASAVEEPAKPEAPAAAPEQTAPVTAPEPLVEESLHAPPPIEQIQVEDSPSELPSAPHSDVAPSDLVPAADELTKENVNKLPDTSHPLASATVASTVASGDAPVNPALPNVSAIRSGMSGHAASALRATAGAGRAASYSRKVMDQQEAVVMPGNHAVDRAAVQFGKMGLDADEVDADEDREEPETRTQLPDDSPAAPRASLPPVPAPAEPPAPAQPEAPESTIEPQAQRPPSGLPSAAQAVQEPSPPQPNAFPEQYNRYGQKNFDPFSQQPQHGQAPSEPFSNQLPGQSQGLPNTSQQEAYAQYYARDYASYYAYGQGQGQEQQRSGSAFGTSAPEAQAQYAAAGPRAYGSQDVPSGSNTPNPHLTGHQAQHSAHMQSGPGTHAAYHYGQYGGNYGSAYPQYASYGSMGQGSHRYGANRPMFDDVRRQQGGGGGGGEDYYANQYGYAHNQGYSSSYGKSGMYGAPHQYSHDYSTSPGNAAFAGREGYGRAGSTQPSDGPQSNSSSNAFTAGMQDPFGRTPSGFGQSQHAAAHGNEDPAKPAGPSPSLQGGRPGSAAQTMTGQQQSGLPHSQNNQQAFGYPQYSGFGNQNNQHSGYGGYGSNNAFAGYAAAGYGGRGGWPGQYGSGQH